jgi:BASS family bile acid:Na+ symporter
MLSGPIPEWVVTWLAVVTVFTVMSCVGLSVVPGDLRRVWERRALLLRGLFAVLVVVPLLALVVARAFALARGAEIGLVLMAIAPGAPVALRRSLDAGGHSAFAPGLQMSVALLAVVSMPLSIAVLNPYYAGHASAPPEHVARQVFFAQLLPFMAGMALRRVAPGAAGRLERPLRRLGAWLMLALAVVALIDVWQPTVDAGWRVATSVAVVTTVALAVGHALGGPEAETRTAVAITSATRNAGLALLIAALNSAPPAITATILAYVVISMLIVLPYALWRRRAPRAVPLVGKLRAVTGFDRDKSAS